MKIENQGVKYKTWRLKKHYCTLCVAHGTVNLCNELQAQFFNKRGKTCRVGRVIFKPREPKPRDLPLLQLAEIRAVSDRNLFALLRCAISYFAQVLHKVEKKEMVSDI